MRRPAPGRGSASSSRVPCCCVDTMTSCQASLLPAYATGVITERVQGHLLGAHRCSELYHLSIPQGFTEMILQKSAPACKWLSGELRSTAPPRLPQGWANCHPPAPTIPEGIEMTSLWTAIAADILSITVLAYAVYYRRY